MPSVDLGYNRDPSEGGSRGLLRVTMGEQRGFDIVPFNHYGEQLKWFEELLTNDTGGIAWVVGGRGTGKSEVMGHLFRETIRKARKIPRLPLYISISGVADSEVTMSLFNKLCREALLQSLRLIKEQGGGAEAKVNPTFSELQKHLMDDWEALEGTLKNPNFQLLDFLDTIAGTRFEESIRLAIVFDDMDKISTRSATEFFNKNQTHLAQIRGHRAVVLTSVTKEFIEEARGMDGLSYCVSRSYLENSRKELRIPEITDLTSAELKQFIDHRIRHLHEMNGSWAFDEKKKPAQDHLEVLQHRKWDSYNTNSMRRNGALLALNTWSARKGLVSLRDVVVNLEGVLNDCPIAKKELTAKILERSLNKNDAHDTTNVKEALKLRIAENVTNERVKEELRLLEGAKSDGNSDLWATFSDLIKDYVAFGDWTQNPTHKDLIGPRKTLRRRIERLTKQFNQDSACFQMLSLFAEISGNDEARPDIHSRTPDELLRKISERSLRLILEEMDQAVETGKQEERERAHAISQKSEPVEVEPEDQVGDGGNGGGLPLAARAYQEVMEEYLDEGQDLTDLGPDESKFIGAQIALQLVRLIYLGKGWGKIRIATEKNFKNDTGSSLRVFQAWYALHVREERSQIEVLHAVHDVIRGVDLQALSGREGEFEEILEQSPIGNGERVFKKITDAMAAAGIVTPGLEMRCEAELGDINLSSLISKKNLMLPSEKITVTLSGPGRPEEEGPGYPAQVMRMMSELTNWLDHMDNWLLEYSSLSQLGATNLDDLIETSLVRGRAVIPKSSYSSALIRINVKLYDDPLTIFTSMLMNGDSDDSWVVDSEETNWSGKNPWSQFTLKGRTVRTHKMIEKLHFVFMKPDGKEFTRREIHNEVPPKG